MQVTIDRFESDRAVLRTDAGQELVVPRRELPTHAHEGDVLTVSFGTDAETTDARAQRAKDALNELLGSSKNDE